MNIFKSTTSIALAATLAFSALTFQATSANVALGFLFVSPVVIAVGLACMGGSLYTWNKAEIQERNNQISRAEYENRNSNA